MTSDQGFLTLEEKPGEGDISLTPLIDVVFQLLVFFMLTSTFVLPSLDLTLPRLNPELTISQDDNSILIEINSAGELWVDQRPVSYIADGIREQEDRDQARLRFDASTPYATITEILQQLGQLGISKIQFVYEISPQ